jgi:hypothetical protein
MVYGFFAEPVAWQMRTDPSTSKKLHSSAVRAVDAGEPTGSWRATWTSDRPHANAITTTTPESTRREV